MDIETLIKILFWAGLVWIGYIYWGYGVLLRTLALALPAPKPPTTPDEYPPLTLQLTVHNEQRHLEKRLENLYELDYPRDRLEILVASDGSTDRTHEILAEAQSLGKIKYLITDRLGKSGAQNIAIPQARHEIVIITDAGTQFNAGFAKAIAGAFADPRVGCVTGRLLFAQKDGAISKNQGMYWNYELLVRKLESRLGILAVASGPVMAFRKALFEPLPINVGDDCIIPLVIARKGYLVRQVEEAIAWDELETEPLREFNSRVRFTLRNWTGTWMEASLLNPFRHPGYAWALWSHKVARWLSPLGVVMSVLCGLFLLQDPIYLAASFLIWLGMAGALVGYFLEKRKISLPVIGTLFSFGLANLAFLLGVFKAIRGHQIRAYKSGVGGSQ